MPWAPAILLWMLLALLMVGHGTLRERLVTPRLGELRAHQASCVTGSLLVLGVTLLAFPWLGIAGSPALQWKVGASWLALTVLFEFGFGRRVASLSWSRLLADYDLRKGRLWGLVLLATAVAPRVAGWARG